MVRPNESVAPPVIATQPVNVCAVCDGGAYTPFARGFDYELQTCANEWQFVRCDDCGHVWLNPRPAVSELATIYPTHYYAYDYETRVSALARRGKEWLDSAKLRTILKHAARPPRTFLDIGCGSGRYLRAMEKRGLSRADISGLELDRKVVASLAAQGFNVACARVEDATIEAGSIDLATMFHVLEHVAAPQPVVGRIASWLSPGGVLAIETPNVESLDQRLFADTYWGGYHIPRHWHLFTPSSLDRLLRGAGLEPVATMFMTGHSFWMYSVHHRLRYGTPSFPRVAKLFDPLSHVVPLAAFTAFDKMRAALGGRTSAMLVLARKRRASGTKGAP